MLSLSFQMINYMKYRKDKKYLCRPVMNISKKKLRQDSEAITPKQTHKDSLHHTEARETDHLQQQL